MINKREFTKRLNELIEQYEDSASSFAESIDVPRSSISHIISGRNNPSLDFIMKIIDTYPEVNLYWLLYGDVHAVTKNSPQPISSESKPIKPPELNFNAEVTNNHINTQTNTSTINSPIERVLILYKDGRFKTYESS